MSPRTQIIGALGVLLVLALIIELVRRQRLRTGYSILWLFAGLTAAILVIFDDFLVILSDLLGVLSPGSLLFTAGIVAALLISLGQSLALTSVWRQNKELALEQALLRWHLRQVQARLQEQEEELYFALLDLESLRRGLFEEQELPTSAKEATLAHVERG
jgi:hypothetical protein